jgi:hypothetical protein
MGNEPLRIIVDEESSMMNAAWAKNRFGNTLANCQYGKRCHLWFAIII